MPVRDKAREWLTRQVVGLHVWDGRTDQCLTMPTDEYDDVANAMAFLWQGLVDSVDWSRVLLEASVRCAELDHAHGGGTRTCGESVQEALLTDERSLGHWERSPTTPRDDDPDEDWPLAVAHAVRFRREPQRTRKP